MTRYVTPAPFDNSVSRASELRTLLHEPEHFALSPTIQRMLELEFDYLKNCALATLPQRQQIAQWYITIIASSVAAYSFIFSSIASNNDKSTGYIAVSTIIFGVSEWFMLLVRSERRSWREYVVGLDRIKVGSILTETQENRQNKLSSYLHHELLNPPKESSGDNLFYRIFVLMALVSSMSFIHACYFIVRLFSLDLPYWAIVLAWVLAVIAMALSTQRWRLAYLYENES